MANATSADITLKSKDAPLVKDGMWLTGVSAEKLTLTKRV